jgi:hypothetical protein
MKDITNKKISKMKLKYEDNYFQYYSDFFQGVEITFRRNKSTGEIMILFTDEIAQKIFEFENLKALLQNKEAQNIMHRVYKKVGQPVFIHAFEHDKMDKN